MATMLTYFRACLLRRPIMSIGVPNRARVSKIIWNGDFSTFYPLQKIIVVKVWWVSRISLSCRSRRITIGSFDDIDQINIIEKLPHYYEKNLEKLPSFVLLFGIGHRGLSGCHVEYAMFVCGEWIASVASTSGAFSDRINRYLSI